MDGYDDSITSGYGYWAGWAIGLFVVIIIIILVVRIIVQSCRYKRWKEKSALDALKVKYVKGEISKAEFEEETKR